MEFYYSEYLDSLTSNIELFSKNEFLMKEQFTDFSRIDKTKRTEIKFDDLHLTISKNGGLIAFCMKKGHYDISKKSKVNKNIIVMFQNSKTKYQIPIDWNNKDRYVVCLDFTAKQDLYAILNDGSVYKIKYNERKAKKKLTSEKFKGVEIVKAKLFEKGFIAFTNISQFYYVKNIKNIFPVLICYLPPYLEFNLNVDFIPIPAENTTSKKIEVLITKQDGEGGIIQIPVKEEGENVCMQPCDEQGVYFEIIGASHITKESPHKLIIKNIIQEDNNDKDKKKKKQKQKKKNEIVVVEPPKIENIGTQPDIGIICSIAISPINEKVAFYNRDKKKAFLFKTTFEGNYEEVFFTCNKNCPNYEEHAKEIEDALTFPEGCQFLFFADDALALSFQRVIIISKPKVRIPLIYISSEENIGKGKLVSKCITEIDGLRVLTNDGVSLISKVPRELYNISNEFSKSASKKLFDIYKNTMNRKYKSDRDINKLGSDLSFAIEELQNASASIYWTEDNNEKEQKETQLFILKVAQFAKKFVEKEEFNFNKFNQNCKEMRTINNLRNDKKYPVYITYREYKEIDAQDIISILIKYNNFQLAANISKFLDYSMKKVLNKYAIALMKREIDDIEKSLTKNATDKEIKERYETLFISLEKVQGISFMKLARKANKYGGKMLAKYLLEQEKSDLVKIPMLLQLKDNFEQTIQIAFESYDFNAVVKVMGSLDQQNIVKILSKNSLQRYFRKILLYLKIYDKSKIIDFLDKTRNFVEIYYLNIKTYYKQKLFADRMDAIKLSRNDLKKFDKNDLFDVKGTKKFLDKLEFITKFKNTCLSVEKAIIHYSEPDPFKLSVYECYKKGIKKDQVAFIDSQNKTIDYSQKKLHLLKFRTYLEMKRPDLIEAQLQKTSLKKLGLNPIHLAEIYYDFKQYDKAAQFLIQVKDPGYFSFVADLFKNMKKYKEWLEFVISNKNIDDKLDQVNYILAQSPGNQRFVDEFCAKYKVILK